MIRQSFYMGSGRMLGLKSPVRVLGAEIFRLLTGVASFLS